MFPWIYERFCRGLSRLGSRTLSRRQLSGVMIGLFVAMLIPLLAIALYNYPADDDFEFVLPAATAWVQTGSVWEVVKAIFHKVSEKYQTWQGDFVSTAFFSLTPMIFNIRLYFLSNWAMLGLVCLSVGWLVRSVTRMLIADKSTFWILYVACMILVLQFMPSIGHSIYWFNGGQYTTAACTLFLLAGLLLRAAASQKQLRTCVAAGLCGFMLGGSFYGPALGAFVLLCVWTLWAFSTRSRSRMACTAALVCFAFAFVISLLAPGNALRQERTGEAIGILSAILSSVLDSFDLIGAWLSPQILAVLLLVGAAAWQPLRSCSFSFRHPMAVCVGLYGVLAASLTPGIYTGFGYDTPRYLNALYFYFLFWIIGSFLYAEGWLLRRLERGGQTQVLQAARNLGKRFSIAFLALIIALTALGGFEFTIMNTASVSALKSLVTGEAAQFHAEMQERQEYIRITDSDEVAVKPLSVQPYVFKNDRLPFQGIYGRVRYMKWYFELFHNDETAPVP